MRYARALAFNLLLYGVTAVASVLLLPLLAAGPRPILAAARGWVRVVLALLKGVVGLDFEVRGRENLPAGPVIVAAKHQSAFDTLVFMVLVDAPAYVLKRALVRIPLWGWLARRARMVAVDRAGGAAALRRMLAEAVAARDAGRNIVIFPEGTRTAPGEQRPYHPGVAALYARLGVPVAPVALNSGLFWARRSLTLHPGRIIIEFLPPIAPGLARDAFMQALRERIETASTRLAEEETARRVMRSRAQPS